MSPEDLEADQEMDLDGYAGRKGRVSMRLREAETRGARVVVVGEAGMVARERSIVGFVGELLCGIGVFVQK